MDCTYKNNIGTFNYRVKLFETIDEAVTRKEFEETGIKVGIDRLFLIHENFFKLNGKEKYHELCIYYLIKPIDNIENINKFLIKKDIKKILSR